MRVGAGCHLIGRCATQGAQPLIGSCYLCGIGGGSEDLRNEVVGIERNGRDKLGELIGAERLHLRELLAVALLRIRGRLIARLRIGRLPIGILLRLRIRLRGAVLRLRRILIVRRPVLLGVERQSDTKAHRDKG